MLTHSTRPVRAFNREIFGDELYEAMRQVKRVFDPDNVLNPGKIVDAPSMTDNLRDPALPAPQPFQTRLSFEVIGGMRGAADRCMNIGLCRKSHSGVMCPSYMATRHEEDATRGQVTFLADSFTSYTEPGVGKAAVTLLERAGYDVHLTPAGVCCGRSSLSKGLVDDAKRKAGALVTALTETTAPGLPIVGCEPSCVLTLRDETLSMLPGDTRAKEIVKEVNTAAATWSRSGRLATLGHRAMSFIWPAR